MIPLEEESRSTREEHFSGVSSAFRKSGGLSKNPSEEKCFSTGAKVQKRIENLTSSLQVQYLTVEVKDIDVNLNLSSAWFVDFQESFPVSAVSSISLSTDQFTASYSRSKVLKNTQTDN